MKVKKQRGSEKKKRTRKRSEETKRERVKEAKRRVYLLHNASLLFIPRKINLHVWIGQSCLKLVNAIKKIDKKRKEKKR